MHRCMRGTSPHHAAVPADGGPSLSTRSNAGANAVGRPCIVVLFI